MTNLLEENLDIEDIIYEVRGEKVMLDSDLAILYGCNEGTKDVNRAVKNNKQKFPERFSFVLTDSELYDLRLKYLTANVSNKSRVNPRVFTEQGIYMLATILKTKRATDATIKIMDTFVNMRKFIYENKDIFKRMIEIENKTQSVENTLIEHNEKFEILFDKFDRKEDLKNRLFFNGEIYDAYSLLVDTITKANKKIIIIDNYVDKVTLDILSKKKVNVTVLIITDKNRSKLTEININKFNRQYPSLKIKYTNIFHDRFIILDNKVLYHLGASLKDLGKKVFAINKIEDELYLKILLERTLNID